MLRYAFTTNEKKQVNAQDIYSVSDNMIRLHGEKVGYLMSHKSLVNEGVDASSKKGRVLLQYEGSPIDFKNIKIKAF